MQGWLNVRYDCRHQVNISMLILLLTFSISKLLQHSSWQPLLNSESVLPCPTSKGFTPHGPVLPTGVSSASVSLTCSSSQSVLTCCLFGLSAVEWLSRLESAKSLTSPHPPPSTLYLHTLIAPKNVSRLLPQLLELVSCLFPPKLFFCGCGIVVRAWLRVFVLIFRKLGELREKKG